jgi:hypothetical protein
MESEAVHTPTWHPKSSPKTRENIKNSGASQTYFRQVPDGIEEGFP